MYSKKELLKGIKKPSSIKSEFYRQYRRLERSIPHDVGIQGSYETGNVGDRALGELFESHIKKWGYRTKIFPHTTRRSNAKYTILGGGGVLHDWYGTEHLETRLNYLNCGEQGFVIGVGVPGFHSDKAHQLIQNGLTQTDLVTVRDAWSKRNLREVSDVDCIVTACPAFCYSDPDVPTNGRTGVNFRPFFQEKYITKEVLENYFDYDDLDISSAHKQYIKNVKLICDRLNNPVFIPFHKKDTQFAREYLDIDIASGSLSVQNTLRKVSQVENMVAMRYHSLIFAAICRKNVLAVAYEPKVSELANRLDIPCYLPQEFIPAEFSPPSNVRVLEDKAQANFNLLQAHMQ